MVDPQQLAAHRAWQERERPDEEESYRCWRCGCLGNLECGHECLGAPEHLCELDIGNDGERGWCWCCRIEDVDRKKAQELPVAEVRRQETGR